MSEFKGTPGPWFVSEVWDVESRATSNMVAAVAGFEQSAEDRANAILIAAAPELLEALRQLRDYAEDVLAVSAEDCDQQHPLMLATSVIKKALGQ